VTSLDPAGRVNLAPFSFFNAFGANPPVVVFSPTLRRDGSKKDTLRNVEATGEFVLNAAVEPLAGAINESSRELPPGESEVEAAGLTTLPSLTVKPPRIAESPVHLECRVIQVLPIGSGPIAANLVIGEVVVFHIDDGLLDSAHRIDPRKLRTIARLGGDWYCRTSDLFAMSRPG
jgi:flavin reductase (DIM6/NTAB) family NADH-FMN oxidoreductase RutF